MPERLAKVAQEYAQRQIKVGDRFEVEPQHVGLLLTLGRIEPEAGDPGYGACDMTAGAPTTYMTRDMQSSSRGNRGRPRKGAAQ